MRHASDTMHVRSDAMALAAAVPSPPPTLERRERERGGAVLVDIGHVLPHGHTLAHTLTYQVAFTP